MEFGHIELISGPVHTGKTTRLAERIASDPETYCGILAPVDASGLRYLEDVVTGERRLLTAAKGMMDTIQVGPYHLYNEVFAWGRAVLNAHRRLYPKRILVVDEIGKLELREAGLAPVCWEVLAVEGQAVVVVRDYLVEAVQKRFRA